MQTTGTPEDASKGERVKERIREEMRAYAITALYLYVWLAALLLYKSTLLREEGLAAVPLGLAAGKALVLGKFVLLGEAAGAGTRLGASSLLHRIAWRSLALVLLLVVLTLVEELVVGWVHGRPAAETRAGLAARAPELGASGVLMLLVLVPFVAVKQLSLALGPGGLRGVLLQRPQ